MEVSVFSIKRLMLPMAACFSVGLLSQAPPKSTQGRTFFHTRGSGAPIVESWVEGGVTYLRDLENGKVRANAGDGFEESPLSAPALQADWKGVSKYRGGNWWFLLWERGHLPKDKASNLYKYDKVARRWVLDQKLGIRASNFECLPDGRFLLFGLHLATENTFSLTGMMSSGNVTPMEDVPFYEFAELCWKTCLTTIDERMVYAYFPYPGRMYGYDLQTHTLRSLKVPWPLISKESIQKDQDKAKGKDCFISAVDHPGAEHCYFVPAGNGKMVFVAKTEDTETGKQLANPDGTRPLLEKVFAFMMFPDDPNNLMEWDTPSQFQLGRWCWNPSFGKLVRWEDFKAPAKRVVPKGSASATAKKGKKESR